jgi:hypothetical protein
MRFAPASIALRPLQHCCAWLAATLLTATVACTERPDPRRTNFELRNKDGVAKYDRKTGRLRRIDIDRDHDGRIETFSYWDASRVIRIEIDTDGDNRIDRWEHYDAANRLSRVGSSRRDDGVEDTWTYPDDAGLLARVETDTDRDGVIDKRETFTGGATSSDARVVSTIDFELDRYGTPARRLLYAPDGTFRHAEVLR